MARDIVRTTHGDTSGALSALNLSIPSPNSIPNSIQELLTQDFFLLENRVGKTGRGEKGATKLGGGGTSKQT